MFGEEDAGSSTVLTAHHEIGGRIEAHFSTSLTAKSRIDFVNAFMGGVAKAEAGGVGDAVTAGREEELGGGVAAIADIEEPGAGYRIKEGHQGRRRGRRPR